MKKKLRMNYISLWISVLMTCFMVFMYFLLGKSMFFPLKVGYVVVTLALSILIGFNVTIIAKKSNDKK